MNIWDNLPRPLFVLAPMDDVTDTVFRQIIAKTAAPDLFFTEFVNVDGLQSAGRPRLLPKLRFTDKERPVIAQIWGKNPENYYKTARDLVEMGYDGIDINMGCPVKTVVRDGCCVALINNRELALEIIQAAKEGASIPLPLNHRQDERRASMTGDSGSSLVVPVGTNQGVNEVPDRGDRSSGPVGQGERGAHPLPLSVKTRLGFNEVDLSWHELLLKQKLNALTIHGRTKKQLSTVPADWDKIGDVRLLRDQLSPATKIIGNGDIMSRRQGLELAAQHQLDGIMIGRGIFQDPFVFSKNSPWEDYPKEQKIELYRKHVELFANTWQDNERRIPTLNKFCKIYINGFDGAKELREQLMNAGSTEELLKILA